MPRDKRKNQYYHVGIRRHTRVHHLVEAGAGGKTGTDFIKMLIEDVDKLIHGEPAVVLSGLLAGKKTSFQPLTGEGPSMKTAPTSPEPALAQHAALSRAARARRSYRMDDEEEE